MTHPFPCMALNKPFSVQSLTFSYCLASLCVRHMDLCFCNMSILLWKNAYSGPLPIFKLSSFFDVELYEIPGMELLGCMAVLALVFLRNLHTVTSG